MKPSAIRSAFVFLLLGFSVLLPGLATAQENLLTNGNFHNGTQGWDGDFDNPSVDGNLMAASSDSSGQAITLRDTNAVRVFQPFVRPFQVEVPTCQLLVKFAYSSDSTPGDAGKVADVLRGFGESFEHNHRAFTTPVAVLASENSPDIDVYPL